MYEIKPDNLTSETIAVSKEFYEKHKDATSSELIDLAKKESTETFAEKIEYWRKKDAIDSLIISESEMISLHIKVGEIKETQDSGKNYKIGIFLKPQYDSLHINGKFFAKSDVKNVYDNPDFVEKLVNQTTSNSWFDKIIQTNILQYFSVFYFGKSQERKAFLSGKVRAWLSYLSYAMFLIMPISALLLFGFYYRKYNTYYPHFVLTLNVHTYIFLTFAIVLGILTILYKTVNYVNPIIPNLVILLLACYQMYYFVKTLKNFYQKSRANAISVSFVISLLYLFILFGIFSALVILLFIIN